MTESGGPLVLVVEDYQDAREMYAAYLQFSGFRVAEATNGFEAIDKTRRVDAGHHPDGPRAPKMDGWEATRRLKLDERTRHIPVVALTGHALAGHAEGARQAGCDSFVTKPCLPDALVAEIQRMLALRKPETVRVHRDRSGRNKSWVFEHRWQRVRRRKRSPEAGPSQRADRRPFRRASVPLVRR